MKKNRDILLQQILQVSKDNFTTLALDVFYYQATHNPLYKTYLSLLNIEAFSIKKIQNIPFLPISFFKTHKVQSICPENAVGIGGQTTIFSSSGTSGATTSQHFVQDLDFYKKNTQKGFEHFYGKIADYCILGLLPAYLERKGSSLVTMVDYFIQLSRHPKSGFFLYDHQKLAKNLKECQEQAYPTLLIGVSFALLDFAETFDIDLGNIIIMETGGMKGRRKELTRTALHEQLTRAFHTATIHSEYGMTELLSQAYSKGDGIFYTSPTMRVLTREITDPFSIQKIGKTGVLNIIDLANLDSCAFIATDDLGKIHKNGSFEVLGRLDNSDIRGCNLLVASN